MTSLTADQITSHTLRQGSTELTVLSLGAVVQSWTIDGQPVILGYADLADYITNPSAMGMLIGRVANRITDAQITFDGQSYDLPANNGPHCIHGGPGGFGWRNWTLDPVSDREVLLRFVSPDGDQGFPGRVEVEARLWLDDWTLHYDITATADRRTPINMAQHLYFNLEGAGTVLDHVLSIDADRYTPNKADLTPWGRIEPVAGTRFDFRTPRTLGDADPDRIGHDASLILNAGTPAATVTAPNGLELTLTTDRPCVQLYTSGTLGRHGTPLPGPAHGPYAALCLEAQDYPDALTHGFPSILHGPDAPYRQRTSIRIAPK